MAGAPDKFGRAVADVRWAGFADVFSFVTGKGATRARINAAVMEQAGWN